MVKVLFFGIIQGATEFLPVSSSGHLYILKQVFGMRGDLLPFFVLLHFATLLAIFVFFHRQILVFLKHRKAVVHIVIITLITAVIGVVIDGFFRNIFENRYWISFFLFVNAAILLKSRNTFGTRDWESMNLKDSVILGILQGIAVFPGISRSGITIVGFLQRGFKPKDAFKFSFIMAIPVITGTFLLKIKALTFCNLPVAGVGTSFIAAFLSGVLALTFLRRILLSRHFDRFSYYCAVAALAVLLLRG